MIKNTSKLEKHLEKHPTDAQSVIALVKTNSENSQYLFDLEIKKKKEKLTALRRGNQQV